MSPATIALLFQILIQYGPDAYAKAVALFHKKDPSQQDFLDLIDESARKNYDAYIAAAYAAANGGGISLMPNPA